MLLQIQPFTKNLFLYSRPRDGRLCLPIPALFIQTYNYFYNVGSIPTLFSYAKIANVVKASDWRPDNIDSYFSHFYFAVQNKELHLCCDCAAIKDIVG